MMKKKLRTPGTLTLIGSGEMSPSMGKVYRAAMARISGPVQAVFLDTPAGFELNVDQISAKAVKYFQHHLQTDIEVVSFKSAAHTSPAEVGRLVGALRSANLIVAGPGSPTYAARNWRDTGLFEAVTRRLAEGAHLVLASAAAIAIGRYALPVYEIYKVGETPHWVEGLDLLQPYGLNLAIIPHWNNAEGATHDTRYCFMGEPRLKLLEQRLPTSTTILGVDEYTACILDLSSRRGHVMGVGQVTLRREGHESTFPTGASFELFQLKGIASSADQARVSVFSSSPQEIPRPEDLPPEKSPCWDAQFDTGDGDMASLASLIELLIAVRAQLRANQRWDLADEIRQRLSGLGVVLEDGPTETTWRRN